MKSKVSVISNVWIREITFEKAGDCMEGHSHTFDHSHLLSVGEIKIEIEGKVARYTAPCVLNIKAGKEHKITSISDHALGYCIHPIRDGYRVEDIVDPKNIPNNEANLVYGFEGEADKVIDSNAQSWSIEDKELK